MKTFLRLILLMVAWDSLCGPSSYAQRLRITVDQTGKALVVDQRSFDLKAGLNEIAWDGVSTQLDLGSVELRSVDRPGELTVLSQRYDFDLANLQALLDRYVGKIVTLIRRDDEGNESDRLTGVLLSSQGGRVAALQTDGGEIRLNPPGEVILDTRQEALTLEPRLLFRIRARQEGRQTLELSAVTRGIAWAVQYNLFLDGDASRARLASWVSLTNSTNASYDAAYWRVLGEEVRRIDSLQPVDEKVIVEYRPAGLQQPLSLAAGGALRLPLTESPDIIAETRLIFDPIGSGPAAPTPPQKLRRVARFHNDVQHGLGVSIPAGKALLYRSIPPELLSAPFSAQTITEASIPATGVGDYFELSIGEAPGLEGERKQTSFRQVADRVQEQDIEIVLRNNTRELASPIAIEHPWGNYEILQNTHPYAKQPDGSVEFPVDVPSQETVTLTYRARVRY